MLLTRISDILTQKSTWKYYKEYSKTQWFTHNQMAEYQLKKFKKLIDHCYLNVPFYTDYMNTNSIKPENIKSLEDIKLFPIITKEIIKLNYDKFTPLNINSIKGVKTSPTGGTTGNVLYKRNDAATRSSVWATFKRFKEWMDISEKDKSMILMGGHATGGKFYENFKKRINGYLNKSITYNIYDTSLKNESNIINSLKNKNISLVRSYSQFLFIFSQKLKSEGLKFNIKAITLTAEPLLPEHRTIIHEVFKAEIYDQYGCGEIGGIAYECNHHKGLHVSEERVFLEVNDKSELIITDLDNFAMPFIRYWNADEAEFSKEKCSCGRQSTLVNRIIGRTSDYLIGPNGDKLHWGYIFHLLWDTEIAAKRNLLKFQLVQTEIDHFIFRIVSDPFSDDEKAMISSYLIKKLGGVTVSFVQENDIENSKSGKYRPVVSKLI